MLRSLKDQRGYVLHAADGDLGEVRDFYFDDDRWTIRYLIADTTRWRPGRRVLIAPSALGEPSWEQRALSVSLTKEQVKHAPGVATELPVFRHEEAEGAFHDKWPEWWGVGGPVLPPAPPELRVPPRIKPPENAGDPHLHSLNDLIGYHAVAGAERTGQVEDVIVETRGWVVRYFAINTKRWRPGGHVLVSPDWVERIDAGEKSLVTELSAARLRACLPFAAPTREHERELFDDPPEFLGTIDRAG